VRINRIFYSLQGEGVYRGEPTVFIRLQGCNLSCSYCDTSYAREEGGGEWTPQEGVTRVSELHPYPRSWVCITGGEPLLQGDEVEEVVKKLREGKYNLTIETNGSIPKPKWWTRLDSWCVDVKCPSSGMEDNFVDSWFKTRDKDQIKFVVGTEEDLVFVKKVLHDHIEFGIPKIIVSPIIDLSLPLIKGDSTIIKNREFLQKVWEFCMDNNIRWSMQDHKLVFGNRRGV